MTNTVAGSRKLQRMKWALLTGCVFFTTTSAVQAQTAWIGGISAENWYDAANWDNGVPTNTDDTTIDTPSNLVKIDGGAASTDSLFVGDAEVGQLWIFNGGVLDTFSSASVGMQVGSSGIVQLEDAGTEWNVTNGLMVGNAGSGGVYIRDGADGSAAILTLAGSATGHGVLEVSGTGSSFTAPVVHVGRDGNGELAIGLGGELFSDAGFVGYFDGSTGSSSVHGAGSKWTNSGGLYVGTDGTGSLEIEAGGGVETVDLYIGYNPTGDGEVLVSGSGSLLDVSNQLAVGWGGTGLLTIEDSGHVASLSGLVGSSSGGTGEVDITGTGSRWDITDGLRLGYVGTDTITVEDGAVLTSGFAYIGAEAGGTGVVSVAGTGSTWNNTNTLYVGLNGNGTLTIENGSTVTSDQSFIGRSTGSHGTVLVDGAGSSWSHGLLTIAESGNGTLTISNDATVTSAAGILGLQAGREGTVTVTNGGDWDLSGSLEVGRFGSGDITITDGGAVHAASANLGLFSGSVGTVFVDGAGSTLDIDSTDLEIGMGGDGALTIVNGGAVTTAGGTSIGMGSGTGVLAIDAQSSLMVAGALHIGANATYVVGLDPASTSAGLIDVGGGAAIDLAANLEIATDGVGSFTVGSQYTILTTGAGTVSGTFANTVDPIAISAFLAFDTVYDTNAVYLDVIQTAQLADAATTPNQTETAEGVEGLGAGSGIYDDVYSLPTLEAAAEALDQLSGEGHASFKGVHLEDSRFVREAALGRAEDGLPAEEAGIWGQLYGATGRLAGDGNAATADSSTAGLVIGADGLLGDVRLGALAHAGMTDLSIADRITEGSSSNYGFGVYGGTKLGGTGLAFGAAYTHHDISISRNVAFGDFTDSLESGYGAATGQVFGEISHEVSLGDDASFTPYGQLAYRGAGNFMVGHMGHARSGTPIRIHPALEFL